MHRRRHRCPLRLPHFRHRRHLRHRPRCALLRLLRRHCCPQRRHRRHCCLRRRRRRRHCRRYSRCHRFWAKHTLGWLMAAFMKPHSAGQTPLATRTTASCLLAAHRSAPSLGMARLDRFFPCTAQQRRPSTSAPQWWAAALSAAPRATPEAPRDASSTRAASTGFMATMAAKLVSHTTNAGSLRAKDTHRPTQIGCSCAVTACRR
mmetsp:Transcript_47286/g.100949  ORF Transcript_47286/g.100949 Transcript_47286/m.100949 type:complete len:205 (+) Transcript_47286:530-1144(+)